MIEHKRINKNFLEHLKIENIKNFKEQKKGKKRKIKKVILTFLVSLALEKLLQVSFSDNSFEHTHSTLNNHTLITSPNQPGQDFVIKHFKGTNSITNVPGCTKMSLLREVC